MDKMKPCPMCGNLLEIVRKNGSKYMRCISGVCIFETARHGHHISDGELIKRCNRRPAEDALKAENAELRYLEKQFESWVADSDTGCPKYQYPDYPCEGEKRFKERFGEDLEFDTIECLNETGEGCWVEYYRWEYKQLCVAENGESAKQADLCCKSAKESEGEDE